MSTPKLPLLDTMRQKAALAERSEQAIENEDLNPKTQLFSDDAFSIICSISSDITSMKNKISSDMEIKIYSDVSSLDNKVSSLESKVSFDNSSLEEKVSSEISFISSDISAYRVNGANRKARYG